jgi:hypothetical protein
MFMLEGLHKPTMRCPLLFRLHGISSESLLRLYLPF